jgi:DNA-binding MarR family transcriptional regulator
MGARYPMPAGELDRVTDSALVALRAFVAVAVRALDAAGVGLTVPQYRALAVLSVNGAQTAGRLAGLLGVDPSTVTRMCDRLVRQRLIRRRADPSDRRSVMVELTATGEQVIEAVTHHRRTELAKILRAIPAARRNLLVEVLEEFATAAGETPGEAWPSSAVP